LVDQKSPNWRDRGHFFGVAARLMRQILVDHARQRWAAKRAALTVPLNEAIGFQQERAAGLLALDVGLNALEMFDARKCKAIELRYFAGLSMEEIGEALDISAVT